MCLNPSIERSILSRYIVFCLFVCFLAVCVSSHLTGSWIPSQIPAFLARQGQMLCKLGHIKNAASHPQFQPHYSSCRRRKKKVKKSESNSREILTVSLFHIFMIRESAEIIKSNWCWNSIDFIGRPYWWSLTINGLLDRRSYNKTLKNKRQIKLTIL